MEIKRSIYSSLLESLQKEDFVIVLYGPRQVGKTTLLNTLKNNLKAPVLMLNGDNIMAQTVLSSRDPVAIRTYLGKNVYVFIDEAQRIEDLGINLKIIKDQLPDIKILATGSSSFDLAAKINEPLTGRKRIFMLYPLWARELTTFGGSTFLPNNLENILRFGSYPKIIGLDSEKAKIRYLQEMVEANLYKDILELVAVKNPKILKEILSLLAFQIGKQVSFNELSLSLGTSIETIKRYLDLLEKAFIIIRIGGFSRNLRKEVTSQSRFYFVDIGVRNTIIRNYNPLALRNDVGMLWENFLVTERIKKQFYTEYFVNNYFWRTWDGQEIDWVEEQGGVIQGFEFKWNPHKLKKIRPPKDFLLSYNNASFQAISQNNYLDFIS